MGPRRLKIQNKVAQKISRSFPRTVWNTTLLLNTVLERLGLDLRGSGQDLRRCLHDFSSILAYFGRAVEIPGLVWACWLGLQPTCQEKPRTCREQSREQIRTDASRKHQTSKLNASKLLFFSQTSLFQKQWAAVLHPGGLQLT